MDATRRLLLLSLLLSLTRTRAAPAAARRVLTVGVEDLRYYPLYDNDHGEYLGFSREVLDNFAQTQGYTFRYVPLPINRLFGTYLGKDSILDLKYPDNAHWQPELRQRVPIFYSDPVVDYIDGLMVPVRRVRTTVADIKRLGTVRGFTPVPYMNLIAANQIRLFEFDSFSALLKNTISGNMDAAYINVAVADYQLREQIGAPGALVFAPDLPFDASAYRLSSIRHPQVIEQMNDYLQTHAKTVQTLKQKYHVDVLEQFGIARPS